MALAAFQGMGLQKVKKTTIHCFGPYGPSRPERVNKRGGAFSRLVYLC